MSDESVRRSAEELERLWAGDFGAGWVDRNARPFEQRAQLWRELLDRYPCRSVLEVGAAHGENLRHLSALVPAAAICGLDVNEAALDAMGEVAPGVQRARATARHLPFRDASFDVVITVGLLIHQPDETLGDVMDEIVRCSARFVICGEYHSDEPTSIRYRDLDGVLFKRDYGQLYVDRFDTLALRETLFLTTEEHGFDRVTMHVFERTDR